MTDTPRILVLGRSIGDEPSWVASLAEHCQLVRQESTERWLQSSPRELYEATLILGDLSARVPSWIVFESVLKFLPEGVALLDASLNVIWSNDRLRQLAGERSLEGDFLAALGSPAILGPDFSPLQTALGAGVATRSVIRLAERKHLELHVAPVFFEGHDVPDLLVVSIRDVSQEMHHRQKLQAIHQAGQELWDLSAEDIVGLSVEDRIDLLKEKIVQFTQDVLEFETVEVRLLDKATKALDPLLNVGMSEEAVQRKLWAEPQANGVTGFVAATGRSYLCDDTSRDQLYLPGAPGARSSLTVPLILHGEVLGTINVESSLAGAFHDQDLQFLELFSYEVAAALNTLELLAAEKYTAVTESTERLLREVAKPVDSILNDTAWILEKYIGHDPAVCERLQRILKHVRGVRQLIQTVGEAITPGLNNPAVAQRPQRPRLRDKRLLVVDGDESVRLAAHELLGRFGCIVETAHNGEEALLMARSFHYDAVLADIRLPDMTGFECFVQVRQIHEDLPVILMTEFGYDPSHSIVKARQMGLKSVLYKPFRMDQLLKEVEQAVGGAEASPAK